MSFAHESRRRRSGERWFRGCKDFLISGTKVLINSCSGR